MQGERARLEVYASSIGALAGSTMTESGHLDDRWWAEAAAVDIVQECSSSMTSS